MKQLFGIKSLPGIAIPVLYFFFLLLTFSIRASAQCSTSPVASIHCSPLDNIVHFEFAGISTGNNLCGAEEERRVRDVRVGEEYHFKASGGNLDQWLAIWIDLNNNSRYDSYEMVYSSTSKALRHSGSIIIPSWSAKGAVSMRVRCKWGGAAITPEQACTTFVWGETEDHKLNLVDISAKEAAHVFDKSESDVKFINLSPNPVTESGTLLIAAQKPVVITLKVFDLLGMVQYTTLQNLQSGENKLNIDMTSFPPGNYCLQITGAGFDFLRLKFAKL